MSLYKHNDSMNLDYSRLNAFEGRHGPGACASEPSEMSDYYSEDEEGSGSVRGLQIQNPFEASPIFIVTKKRSRTCSSSVSSPSTPEDCRNGDPDVESSNQSYWSTIATSQERDNHIIREVLANPKDTKATFDKLSKLFGWSVEAVQLRWKALNPNRCQGSSFSPQKTCFKRFLPVSPRKAMSSKRPRLVSNNRTSTSSRSTFLTVPLSETDKDALLIRSVSIATSLASPVDWKHLASVYSLSIEDMKMYYKCMNVSQRTDELILLRVSTNKHAITNNFWESIARELNINNVEARWKCIAISEQACAFCGRQPCWCAERDAPIELCALSDTSGLIRTAVDHSSSSSPSPGSSDNVSSSSRSSSSSSNSNSYKDYYNPTASPIVIEATNLETESASHESSERNPPRSRISQFLRNDIVYDNHAVLFPTKKEIIYIDLTDD